MAQLHKRFTDSQVKDLIKRYLNKEVERKYIQEILDIKKRRFFILVKQYKKNPENFSIQYTRKSKNRKIPPFPANFCFLLVHLPQISPFLTNFCFKYNPTMLGLG